MRIARVLAAALALAAMVPRDGTAQQALSFKDAWFWGIKAGGMDFTSGTGARQEAPMFGAEWMITRSHGGLYVSFSQAFFNDQAGILTNTGPADTLPLVVNLKDMRRLDMAAMIFPGSSLYTHPYAGIGFSLKQIATATPAAAYTSVDQANMGDALITSLRTGASPYFIIGSQFRFPLFSLFVQGTASPALKNMFLYNGSSFHLTYEVGLRYNAGGSIDKY